MTEDDLAHPAAKIPTLAPNWSWLAWVTRIGTQVLPSPRKHLVQTAILPLAWQTPASAYDQKQVVPLTPYALDETSLIDALQEHGCFQPDQRPQPAQKLFRSETSEIIIDGSSGCLILNTPRTAGGYAPAGQFLKASKGGVEIGVKENDATVWVSSLDAKPIGESSRLLVTHLTDLQNTGIRYGEAARQTLLDWGHLPYLVRAGQADISIRLSPTSRIRGGRTRKCPQIEAPPQKVFTTRA